MRRKMLATLAVCGLPTFVLIFAFAASVRADSLSDKIDEARIKARAGDPAGAVQDLEELEQQHPKDPRISFYRARYLVDLDRRNDAADAVEIAERTFKIYKDGGGKDDAILAISDDLTKLADDLLLYRRQARAILADYQVKGLKIARDLLAKHQHEFALYVVEELAAASEQESEEVRVLRDEILKAAQAAQDDSKDED